VGYTNLQGFFDGAAQIAENPLPKKVANEVIRDYQNFCDTLRSDAENMHKEDVMKRIGLWLVVFAAVLGLVAGCGKKDDKDAMYGKPAAGEKKAALGKDKYMDYLKKKLEMVSTPEYAAALAKYKAEAGGVKEIMERQKIYEKYFGDHRQKEMDLLKSCGITLSDVMNAAMSFKTDKEVMDLVFKLSKYAVY